MVVDDLPAELSGGLGLVLYTGGQLNAGKEEDDLEEGNGPLVNDLAEGGKGAGVVEHGVWEVGERLNDHTKGGKLQ